MKKKTPIPIEDINREILWPRVSVMMRMWWQAGKRYVTSTIEKAENVTHLNDTIDTGCKKRIFCTGVPDGCEDLRGLVTKNEIGESNH